MKIRLLEEVERPGFRTWRSGLELEVTNDYGRQLIADGKAEEIVINEVRSFPVPAVLKKKKKNTNT